MKTFKNFYPESFSKVKQIKQNSLPISLARTIAVSLVLDLVIADTTASFEQPLSEISSSKTSSLEHVLNKIKKEYFYD